MREIEELRNGWLYHPDETPYELPKTKSAIYRVAKADRAQWGPASYAHADGTDPGTNRTEITAERWFQVSVPHDYIIGQTPNENENNTLGYFHYHNAWYRKHFSLPKSDCGKRLTLLFEGVTGNATVYLNGCLLKHNFCGFTPFEVDITDHVFWDKENVLAVYVDLSLIEGWWYAGGGIYRKVWLIKTNPVAIDLYGTFIAPQKAEKNWQVPVTADVLNTDYEPHRVWAVHKIIAPNGSCALQLKTPEQQVPARGSAQLAVTGALENPELWDVEQPTLYTLKTELYRDGALCDEVQTAFGFRTAEFHPQKGFLLNGRPVKIKGVCAHQDFGLTGKAVPDNIYRYRVKLLKQMGANGYRTAHYPHDPATLQALDEAGFLVFSEVRHFESSEESFEQIKMAVRRDRNHPCIILWSTGNEEMHYHPTPQGKSIQKAMLAEFKKHDPYRPVTTAVAYIEQVMVLDDVDVIAANYRLKELDRVHRQYPQKAILSSENCAVGTSYGCYFGNRPNRGQFDARDHDICTDEKCYGREGTWKYIASRDWLCGGFQWAAFNHRGECVWPRLNSVSGAMDMFLQKKDAFYQNQSHWCSEPMVHLLPHWNLTGLEGKEIKVWAYTNCEEVELLLNGRRVAKSKIEKFGHGEWPVIYEPGTLKAVGYRGGKPVAVDEQTTTGSPADLKLRLENGPVVANGQDIALVTCYCIDENGLPVPTAEPFVCFDTDEGGTVIGTGSADFDHTPVTCTDRKMYAGRITVGILVKNLPTVRLFAKAEHLKPAVLEIKLQSAAGEVKLAEKKVDDLGGHLAK